MISKLNRRAQSGMMMLEALFGILIFSLGVLAIIGLQAQSIRNSTEARDRMNASFLTNQIVSRMWAARNTVTGTSSLSTFAHRPSGAVCSASGASSSNAAVTEWLSNVNSLLPDAAATKQSVVVDTTVSAYATVTVRLCWKSATGDHNMVTSTRIAW